MPLSYQNYTGDNVTTTFNIPFTYTATSEISVTVDGVAQTGLTFPSASQVQLTSAPASSTVVQVRRTTDLTARAVDFASGSVLTEEDLDNANIQIFHSSQEAVDLTDDTIQEDIDSKWDAESKVIKNVANPTNAQDAATKDYLENTWLTTADKAQLNSLNTTNLNIVANNNANINAVAADATDIGTVSTNIASVNTVATNIADVITVANDLNEAISEIETAADDLNEAVSDIDTVSTNIANVNTVGGAITNVNTVATNIGNVNTVGGNITNVNTVGGISGNVTTVAGISANVGTVAGISGNVTTVAGISGDVSTVSGNNSNVTIVANDISNVNSVAGNATNINSVAGNSTNINTVATNNTNINTVATNISNVNSVGGSIANVNTVATNLASVNNFGEVYRIASEAPTSSLNSGDLYFNTSTNVLNVYGASGWQNAGSSINGTSQRYHYDITSAVTSVTGADANGNTLAYDAGYVDVYVNGVRMSTADVTVTSGDTVAFTSALAAGDEVDIVGYGTFAVASLNADNLNSGTVPDARITGAYTGITNLTMSGNLTVDTSTLYVDSANNRVGVGTVSPSKPLHVFNSGTSYVQISGNSRDLFLGQDATGGAIFSTGAVPMYFSTNSTERMRIDSSGNVGIGVVPNTSWHSTLTALQLGGNGSLSAQSSAGASKQIYLSQNVFNDGDQKYISTDEASNYYQGDGKHIFQVASSGSANAVISWNTAMTLDNSGNLLVGTTNSLAGINNTDEGISLRTSVGSASSIAISRASGITGYFNRNSDGDILSFRKDGSAVGSIGVTASDQFYIARSTGNHGIKFKNSATMPSSSAGADADNVQDLGSSSARWKDLYLSGGAYIGGTGSANYLDDYEEGSFTPTFSGAGGPTHSAQHGKYTKIGNRVIAHLYIAINSKNTMSGTQTISGLPFASQGDSSNYNACSIWMGAMDSTGVFNGNQAREAYLGPNKTKIQMYAASNGGVTQLDASHMANTTDVMLTVSYDVA